MYIVSLKRFTEHVLKWVRFINGIHVGVVMQVKKIRKGYEISVLKFARHYFVFEEE